MPTTQTTTGLVWFRHNLRTHDHQALSLAVQQCDSLLAVYVLPQTEMESTPWGFRKMGDHRLRFLLETLQDLSQALHRLGIPLLIRKGDVAAELGQLINAHHITQVYTQHEWTAEEVAPEQQLQHTHPHLHWTRTHDQWLLDPEKLPYSSFEEVPDVFTSFRKKVELSPKLRPVTSEVTAVRQPIPLLPDPIPAPEAWGGQTVAVPEYTAFPFQGGETAAQQRVQHYLFDTQLAKVYKETRNGMLGADYSTKFSAWLANGSLSAGYIMQELKAFEAQYGANESTYWIWFELLWREFFKVMSRKYGNKLFLLSGFLQREYPWRSDAKFTQRWIEGRCGQPFVDAHMNELRLTGWMSNRGRQNVASFWAKIQQQDWRIGAAYFESQLLDYDVHSNYGNWQYNAGVGNDPRDRVFSLRRQAEMYDPDGAFVRLWNPNAHNR